MTYKELETRYIERIIDVLNKLDEYQEHYYLLSDVERVVIIALLKMLIDCRETRKG